MALIWNLALPASPVASAGQRGDRYIPTRAGAQWGLRFHSLKDPARQKQKSRGPGAGSANGALVYSALLRNELLGGGFQRVRDLRAGQRSPEPCEAAGKKLFSYVPNADPSLQVSPFSLSPVSNGSRSFLTSLPQFTRNISKNPFRILEAPDLRDDFYLNLLDWSCLNVVTVGLGTRTFLWNATTCQASRLCDASAQDDSVTSVGWSERGKLLAVGTQRGVVQIWDVATEKKVSALEGHSGRVGVLAWNADQISSGSRDTRILQRDVRAVPLQSQRWLRGHKQEVCGLRWSPDHQALASGGNDNRLLLWDPSSLKPVQQFAKHGAAVKALAWSPHQHGLLASGGGSADCCIRFWNTLTGQPLQRIHTGSQVCNLAWSRHSNELVSTHGYSENQIIVWRYSSLCQVAKLTGHSFRVLYLAMSPDGQAIVTGAGDETLRFWNIFPKSCSAWTSGSALNLFTRIR